MNLPFDEMIKQITDFMKTEAKTETVMGEPFELGAYKCVPVIKVGMGFGSGGGRRSHRVCQGRRLRRRSSGQRDGAGRTTHRRFGEAAPCTGRRTRPSRAPQIDHAGHHGHGDGPADEAWAARDQVRNIPADRFAGPPYSGAYDNDDDGAYKWTARCPDEADDQAGGVAIRTGTETRGDGSGRW